MTVDMRHEEATQVLEAVALDTLPGDEQERVLAHVATCAVCGPELARLRDAVALLAFAVPAVPRDGGRPDRVRTRLLARARRDVSVADSGKGSRRGGGTRDVVRAEQVAARAGALAATGWVLAAAMVISAILITRRDRTQYAREMLVERHASAAAMDSLRRDVAVRDAMLQRLTGPKVAVVDLAARGTQPPSARMFWDRATNGWTLVAHDLPAPPSGKTYQLWLVTPTAKISAGTFAPRPNGDAVVQATYALAPDSLRAIAVSEEPTGGSPQPTGSIIVAGMPPPNRPGK